MFNKIENLFYLTIMLISVFSILSALYIEHILSVPACKLCLYQRIPYIFSTIICFFGYFFPKRKIWIYLLILIFICSLAISGYHVGIEKNIFTEFSGCTNQNLNTIDKSKLLESLNNFLPNCKDIHFKIFGFSLATINFLLSIVLTAIIVRYFYYEKNK
tara:strand:- start:32 stop:508 length:477 start_codon:yes stop_codon:yes gene_type:complete